MKFELERKTYDTVGCLIDEGPVIFMPCKQGDLFHPRSSWVDMTNFNFIWLSLVEVFRRVFFPPWDRELQSANLSALQSSSLILIALLSHWTFTAAAADIWTWRMKMPRHGYFFTALRRVRYRNNASSRPFSLSSLTGSNSNTHKRRWRTNMPHHQIWKARGKKESKP